MTRQATSEEAIARADETEDGLSIPIQGGKGRFHVHLSAHAALDGHVVVNYQISHVVRRRFSAVNAGAFFTASTQRWLACANRQLTATDRGNPSVGIWAVGPVLNTNGILSATKTLVSLNGNPSDGRRTCRRALTVANNVAIDINACAFGLPADAAIDIAHQIAAKVPTT